MHFVRQIYFTSPYFLINALQVLRLLDNPRRRHISFPIPSPQTVEVAHHLDWCSRDLDLFDMDSVDCGYGILERLSSVRGSVQPMYPCVLWATEGVVR